MVELKLGIIGIVSALVWWLTCRLEQFFKKRHANDRTAREHGT